MVRTGPASPKSMYRYELLDELACVTVMVVEYVAPTNAEVLSAPYAKVPEVGVAGERSV